MKKYINLVEKYLIRIIVIFLVALVVVQGLMTRDDLRLYLSLGERLEGQYIGQPALNKSEDLTPSVQNDSSDEKAARESPQAQLTISIERFSSLPRAVILVNHRPYREFTEKDMRLELAAGDIVEIDTTFYSFPVSFSIKDTSSNVAYPEKNQVYQANQGIVMVGKIIVK
ncbi:MAG: hypothetical protein ABRQ26_09630 [Syntrophomonadaceae bacterium]